MYVCMYARTPAAGLADNAVLRLLWFILESVELRLAETMPLAFLF
jgi:hypothetical protein